MHTYMKSTREKTGAAPFKISDTRERILDAALNLISEKGYLGTSTREIARRVGIAELTIFRHFGSKEKLFECVLKKYTFLPRLKELMPQLHSLPYEDSLVLVGLRFLETLKERKSLCRIMLSEITVYPEKAKDLYKDFIDEILKILADYFKTLQAKGTLKKELSPFVAARAFLGTIHSYFLAEEILKNRSISKKEARKVVGELADIFANGSLGGADKIHLKGVDRRGRE